MSTKGRVTRLDHAIGAGLCLLYVAVLLYTAPAIGLSRDEGTYVVAGKAYAGWFEQLAKDPSAALTRASIDAAWKVNHEHPSLVKSLFALSYMVDDKLGIFTRESLPFRFVGMLSAGLLLWLIHIFGTRLHGRRAGLFAALAYALLPRPFYHAHLDCFDVPITLAVTAVTYAYFRSLSSRRWAWLCGACFGLALATKHNSWILPGIFAIHFAYVWLSARRAGERFSPVPHWLIAMVALGPAIFIGSWPWLWHGTLGRIGRYAAFHLEHDYYNMAYFGENHFLPPFPIGFPWVMTLYTVPITTLLLAVVGLVLAGRRELADLRVPGPGRDHHHAAILLVGCLLAPMLLISMPWTPIFGGTKHWFTAYPFMAIFAGVGFDRALQVWGDLFERVAGAMKRAFAPALGVLMLLPALVETAHSHPFGLSHYGMAAGFVPGSADRGMNRQFWGFTTGSLVDFFYEHLPEGGRVYVCDMTHASFRMLGRDGLLPLNIRPTYDIARADYAIVHHEHHFAEVDHQIWTLFSSAAPVHVLTYDGVPIVSVYENPRRRARKSRAAGSAH
ncbi:MAG: glycosyltransferase family 39 protein [Myxococcales bacterium]|nr:glycosyltransferase family 39 protein [Myxococcales bacterium]